MSRSRPLHIALVGDFDASITAHRAIQAALPLAGRALGLSVEARCLATEQIDAHALAQPFDAIWCMPGSPYRSMEGALAAIRHAREQRIPFLGTCGGFQHALLEYARNVMGWADAEHGENTPDAAQAIVSPLSCSLVEVRGGLQLVPGSLIAQAYETLDIEEAYRCNYGLNPAFADALLAGALRCCARDAAGEVRAVQLEGHPFFVATLFQPERAALEGRVPPLLAALLHSASRRA
ncbi:hypothetical protein PMM47T1_23532 [Pseudomonas sp. M47T1]|uniref:CTP synthase C-terminal region-related (seleno)protein n=1 Tax=unclassified Pseudomonas TaxID=196821 RepID=UPI0002607B8E|nr:CTP synthase [Pseudomonas sp. M47T1]EIK94083.1 hypothetical protein PMM47T1_23532 [Pseudomonas sp. M47T1]